MTKAINKLSVKKIMALSKPGYYGDGNGLWLQVSKYDSKNWVYRFTLNGKSREMGLGSISDTTLAKARNATTQYRDLVRNGNDPIESRKANRLKNQRASAKTKTFDECVSDYINANEAGWKNAKHRQQWENTLKKYASPVIGKLSVANIDTGFILEILEPIWKDKTETATRLRGRIEKVLDWATTRSYRDGLNPARWKGHLGNLLPKPNKVAKIKHHSALPFLEVGAFTQQLYKQAGIAAKALEFTILTAARTSEVLNATWDEIDLEARTWTVPADRMKAGKEHRIPLSERAVTIAKELKAKQSSNYIFPGTKLGKPLSNMSMLTLLKRMGKTDLTVHGFRSSFRDWAGETTAYPREVIEHALAHQLKDKAEAAYQRGTLFNKRARLMSDWGKYCGTVHKTATVTGIRKVPV